jgi:hypothetical protein
MANSSEAYGELKNVCVWVKDNAGMGSLYRSQHELVLVFKRPGEPHRNNVQLGLAATAAMCGAIPAPIPSPAAVRRGISWRCTRR